jgi:predicted phage-related endonuclease
MPLEFQQQEDAPIIITAHPTRPFLVVQTEQRSPAWFEARLARVTGSNAGSVWNKTTKGARTADWQKYQDQLLAERLTGLSADDVFITRDMQRGIDLEPKARDAVAKILGVNIRETGFLAHKDKRIGSSLDGDIDDFRAVVEIKCPKTTTHLGYLEDGDLPLTYAGQLLHNLYVSKAETLYFASFDDRLPEHLQVMVVERHAKDLPLEEYERELDEFLAQLHERVERLQAKANK